MKEQNNVFFRAVVNQIGRSLNGDVNHEERINQVAATQASKMPGDAMSLAGGVLPPELKAGLLVVLACYGVLSSQLKEMRDKRVDFDKQLESDNATFVIQTNKERVNYTDEEKFVKEYVQLIASNPLLLTYSGIHEAILGSDKNIRFYAVPAFFRMSHSKEHENIGTSILEKERSSINLFLEVDPAAIMEQIKVSFQADWRIKSYSVSCFQGENYLNNRRVVCIVINSLANLLWNLQYLVSTDTGFPLTTSQCISICTQAGEILMFVLKIKVISKLDSTVRDFIIQVNQYIQTLKAAYEDSLQHQFNFSDVTNQAGDVIRVLDRGLFKLIYQLDDHDEESKNAKHDNFSMSKKLAQTVGYLNKALNCDPGLAQQFNLYRDLVPEDRYVNFIPTTVIDCVLVFCYLPHKERHALLDKLLKNATHSIVVFGKKLQKLDVDFIKPIRTIAKKVPANENDTQVLDWTALHFLPLLTLAVGDYQPDIDRSNCLVSRNVRTGSEQVQAINDEANRGYDVVIWDGMDARPPVYNRIYFKELDDAIEYTVRLVGASFDGNTRDSINCSGTIALKALQEYGLQLPITRLKLERCLPKIIPIIENNRDITLIRIVQNYRWDMAQLVNAQLGNVTMQSQFNVLPKYLSRMTETKKLLDGFNDLIEHYRGYLQKKAFRSALLKSFEHMKKEFNEYYTAMQEAESYFKDGAKFGINVESIIKPMIAKLQQSISALLFAITQVKRVVLAPDFIEQEKQAIVKKLTRIENIFFLLYGEESGILTLLPRDEVTPSSANSVAPYEASEVGASVTVTQKTYALKKLVQVCYDALSWQSRYTYKGKLMEYLLRKLDEKILSDSPEINDDLVQECIMELAKVTASYTNTVFFTAPYGETRSAQALISKILDPEFNARLPVAAVLFSDPHINVEDLTIDMIVKELNQLRSLKSWEPCVDDVHIDAPLLSASK